MTELEGSVCEGLPMHCSTYTAGGRLGPNAYKRADIGMPATYASYRCIMAQACLPHTHDTQAETTYSRPRPLASSPNTYTPFPHISSLLLPFSFSGRCDGGEADHRSGVHACFKAMPPMHWFVFETRCLYE